MRKRRVLTLILTYLGYMTICYFVLANSSSLSYYPIFPTAVFIFFNALPYVIQRLKTPEFFKSWGEHDQAEKAFKKELKELENIT